MDAAVNRIITIFNFKKEKKVRSSPLGIMSEHYDDFTEHR